MATVLNVLHVVGAVFLAGPMAILPMSAMRALRTGERGQVATLARSTFVFSLLSILVVFLGFGLLGVADERFHLSIGTPWILGSLILYAIALLVNLFVVVPAMRSAAEGDASVATRPLYGRIAGGSGVSALLLVAVVVLMVWKP
ncbi:DUF2269 family protein [Naasia aerilata]|uniref:DUF2269 family protein n=1 Tax=Naasia aerilata TaxID=1162966 RepID=A0ABM8GE80_9MICO|nr:DUF2269 family protein [Naasia aerilata]BDZ46620.1 hypothetical protein GCM10025866_25290 [Naasia aerilata]